MNWDQLVNTVVFIWYLAQSFASETSLTVQSLHNYIAPTVTEARHGGTTQ